MHSGGARGTYDDCSNKPCGVETSENPSLRVLPLFYGQTSLRDGVQHSSLRHSSSSFFVRDVDRAALQEQRDDSLVSVASRCA